MNSVNRILDLQIDLPYFAPLPIIAYGVAKKLQYQPTLAPVTSTVVSFVFTVAVCAACDRVRFTNWYGRMSEKLSERRIRPILITIVFALDAGVLHLVYGLKANEIFVATAIHAIAQVLSVGVYCAVRIVQARYLFTSNDGTKFYNKFYEERKDIIARSFHVIFVAAIAQLLGLQPFIAVTLAVTSIALQVIGNKIKNCKSLFGDKWRNRFHNTIVLSEGLGLVADALVVMGNLRLHRISMVSFAPYLTIFYVAGLINSVVLGSR